MEKEINYIVLVSTKDYKTDGMKVATAPQQQRILFLNRPIKDQSFFGESLGKKEFFWRLVLMEILLKSMKIP
ncbi:hypothetical protein N6B72_08045 [Chryseobacterium soli]|uniref:Uncharacterized protein n=1 Tax=Chryseobacterium soli TaxID=445961 RepID=A0A086ABQ9_9FLAO|nr:hypothetical protein [Chryseobacterium soli]KFF14123.1 hypothetical protein IW15_01375 [Chryseobacterium soli]MDV7696868.1 hypothetical protein [Chryseobacterium soli]